MTDPYEVLGLDRDADETAIRKRYLELVRQYPPDRDPQRFGEIREAYEKLRDPAERMNALLFDLKSTDSMDIILSELRNRLRKARIPTKTLLSLAE
jgi:curved DNA-binding protein CbpA